MATAADLTRQLADVDRIVGPLTGPALRALWTSLGALDGLDRSEQEIFSEAAQTVLRGAVWPRVSRVVLLEFHAARMLGQLSAPDPQGRWREWVDRLTQAETWKRLGDIYPAMLPRVETIVRNRCAAVLRTARRFAHDREQVAALVGGDPTLVGVEFGAGDSHQGGQTVAVVQCRGGRVVYKPRSVRVDAALGALLPQLLADEPEETRIRVPGVLPCRDEDGEYGWAAHVAHRYCENDAELRTFYRNMGHWLAVTRLLACTDLHSENLIACGPVPVVVDCETLLSPPRRNRPSGYGDAVDLAMLRMSRSVLRTGLLPGRIGVLGMRGMDISGLGNLPDEQPQVRVPAIVDYGADDAHVATVTVESRRIHTHHPSPEPDLDRYWPDVVAGFTSLSERLAERDRAGQIAPLLTAFADCPVRVLMRDTVVYAELIRMLFHPSSLRHPRRAADEATRLLVRNARNNGTPADDPGVVAAEVADMQVGDVPVFTALPATGEITGPRGVPLAPAGDLVAAALETWRTADLGTDQLVVQAALVSAYLNDGVGPERLAYTPAVVRVADLDRRRRAQMAAILRRVHETALFGDDGTVTWLMPSMRAAGWMVAPLGPDLYDGAVGVATLLAGYQREVAAGRADEVPAVADLLDRVLRTLRLGDERARQERVEAEEAGIKVRPYPPGAYYGLASRVWGWLLLADLQAVPEDEAVRRATAVAEELPEAIEVDDRFDLLSGMAGAIVPLLHLAGRSGDDRWHRLAVDTGRRLVEKAVRSERGACWPSSQFPEGLGGFSHGATGIGWSLARLAEATGEREFAELAEEAFAYEESLYIPQKGGWRDVRDTVDAWPGAKWCHGSVGIGLVAADMLRRGGGAFWRDVLARAARYTVQHGFGRSHTFCHGDLSAWELLSRARSLHAAPDDWDPEAGVAEILTTLEEQGPVAGLAHEVFSPALMSGHAGVVYGLLRTHPENDLPSILLPDLAPRAA